MTRPRRFLQLDVFSSQLFEGNPLAVVVDAQGLDEATMQRIARWTNLSETSFLLPPTRPQGDYRVRIFTPRQELPFAGHPSVGSAYVAIETGLVAAGKHELVQECAAGLLPVRVEGDDADRVIQVQAPPAELAEIDDAQRSALVAALGIASIKGPCCLVNNGPHWLIADLLCGASVRSLEPLMADVARLCRQHGVVGVSVFGHEENDDAVMAVRAFCPADGIPEDPVTGSANAAIMAMLAARPEPHPYGARYRASQGREVGRNGYVDVVRDAASGAISIGGRCVIGVRGELAIF